MALPRRRPRDEIERTIANYEMRLAQARADLAHVEATIAIFEAAGDIHRLFRRGDLPGEPRL